MTFDTVTERYYYYDDKEKQEEIFRNIGWCLQNLSYIADIEADTDNKFVQNVQDNLDIIDKAYQILQDVRDIEYPTFETPSIVEVTKKSPLEYLTTPDKMLKGRFLDGMSCGLIHRGILVLREVVVPHLNTMEDFDSIDPRYFADEGLDYTDYSGMIFDVLEFFNGLFGTKSWLGEISTDTIQSIQNCIHLYEDNQKALHGSNDVSQIIKESKLTYEDVEPEDFYDTYQFSDYIEIFFMIQAAEIVSSTLSEVEKILNP